MTFSSTSSLYHGSLTRSLEAFSFGFTAGKRSHSEPHQALCGLYSCRVGFTRSEVFPRHSRNAPHSMTQARTSHNISLANLPDMNLIAEPVNRLMSVGFVFTVRTFFCATENSLCTWETRPNSDTASPNRHLNRKIQRIWPHTCEHGKWK